MSLVSLTRSNQPFDLLFDYINRLANPPQEDRERVESSIVAFIEDNFANERSGDGRWGPLRPRTQIERQLLGYDPRHPILYRTGSLLDTLRGGTDHVNEWSTSQDGWQLLKGSQDFRMFDLEHGRAWENFLANNF